MSDSDPRTEIFWRKDIESVLRAIERSSAAALAEAAMTGNAEQLRAYHRGYLACLGSVASAFGVALRNPQPTAHFPGRRLRDWE